jgi:hypothetical protein
MCMMIKEKYIDPFTDFGFKRIFGTEKNKRFLISFLNVIDRKAIFDVYCTDENSKIFSIK